ncbi:MAG: hemin uptake protein HemP [Beijerinckiaceae bacterium]|jgi:hemin uptake protein HemP|nr:hemin uptake protein HemP [Beijerinckiaceae bacterium]
MNSATPPDPAARTAAPSAQPEIPVVDVRQLLGEGREIVLMHLGEAYRLRITARERLILTK